MLSWYKVGDRRWVPVAPKKAMIERQDCYYAWAIEGGPIGAAISLNCAKLDVERELRKVNA